MQRRSRRSMTGLLLGVTALLAFGCQSSTDDDLGPAGGTPKLAVIATANSGACTNALPVMGREELAEGRLITAEVIVTGIDPSRGSNEIAPGAGVKIFLPGEEGDPNGTGGRFLSTQTASDRDPSREYNQSVSTDIAFTGNRARDEFFCTAEGNVALQAIIEDYPPGSGAVVRTDPTRGFPIRCLPLEQWQCECDVCPEPPPDLGVDMGPPDLGPLDAGPPDAAQPQRWSLSYNGPDPDTLVVSLRGGRTAEGRGDSVELEFKISELDVPIPNVAVQFRLSPNAPPFVRVEPREDTTDESGIARVTFIAGSTPGVAAVQAEATYRGETQVLNSPPIAIRGGIPSQRGLHFACVDQTIAAFSSRPTADHWNLALTPGTDCAAQLVDRLAGRVDSHPQVFFLSEAGSVNQAVQANDEGQAVTHLRIGNPPPSDVQAQGYERDIDHEGRNPTDGLVRLVAATRGEEDFTDVNGNKFYEDGIDIFDAEHDRPEPFVDANDNGQWDLGEDFRDLNANGVWDDSNGIWDANTEIWESTNVLWVGQPSLSATEINGATDVRSFLHLRQCVEGDRTCTGCTAGCLYDPDGLENECAGADISLDDLGRVEFEFRFADDNGNCVVSRRRGSVAVTGGKLKIFPEAARAMDLTGGCWGADGPEAATYRFVAVDDSEAAPDDQREITEVTVTVSYEDAVGVQVREVFSAFVCII